MIRKAMPPAGRRADRISGSPARGSQDVQERTDHRGPGSLFSRLCGRQAGSSFLGDSEPRDSLPSRDDRRPVEGLRTAGPRTERGSVAAMSTQDSGRAGAARGSLAMAH